MAEIGIITNPYAKMNLRNPEQKHVLGYVAGRRGTVHVTYSLDEVDKAAAHFADRQMSYIAIHGGDGTIARTLTAVIRAYGNQDLPTVVLLRGGTMNVLARNLRIRGRSDAILDRFISKRLDGSQIPVRSVPILKINDFYGFIFGTGVAPRFLKLFYESKTGPAGVLKLIARLLTSGILGTTLTRKVFAADLLNIVFDKNQPLSIQSWCILASTLAQLPLGVRLFPGAEDLSAEFSVVSYTDEGGWAFMKVLPDAVLFPDFAPRLKFRATAKTMTIASDSALNYTVDGELFAPTEKGLTVSLGPKVRFALI